MATARQYGMQARDIEWAIGRQMGVDLARSPKTLRVILNVVAVMFGVVCKLLVDKGLVTNQDLTDAFGIVQADTYPDEPAEPPVT